MTTCPHGKDASFCSTCRYLPRATDPIMVEETFQTLDEQDCAACPEPIRVGQVAVKFSDGWVQHKSHGGR